MNPTPIQITIDQEHLRATIRQVIDEETRDFAAKLRAAAGALDPTWFDEQMALMEQDIRAKIAREAEAQP